MTKYYNVIECFAETDGVMVNKGFVGQDENFKFHSKWEAVETFSIREGQDQIKSQKSSFSFHTRPVIASNRYSFLQYKENVFQRFS